jgi:hypothetical protein
MSTQSVTPVAEAGPVLTRGPTSEALVGLIRSLHPGARLVDRGAYLRVLVPGGCRLSRADIEGRLGRPFRLPADLEELMPSWKGTLAMSDDEVSWGAEAGVGP